jgi:hypothetical protein
MTDEYVLVDFIYISANNGEFILRESLITTVVSTKGRECEVTQGGTTFTLELSMRDLLIQLERAGVCVCGAPEEPEPVLSLV